MENIQNEFMANFYTNMMILIKSDSKVSSKYFNRTAKFFSY